MLFPPFRGVGKNNRRECLWLLRVLSSAPRRFDQQVRTLHVSHWGVGRFNHNFKSRQLVGHWPHHLQSGGKVSVSVLEKNKERWKSKTIFQSFQKERRAWSHNRIDGGNGKKEHGPNCIRR
jgi:hypothetical protein